MSAENTSLKRKYDRSRLKEIIHPESIRLEDVIRFGQYHWHVIDIVMDIYTVYCTEIVAMMPYHDRAEPVTWETCFLRKWLNRDFYDTFTPEENEYIL